MAQNSQIAFAPLGNTVVIPAAAVVPGDDYAGEDARVKAICKATHTADVIAAYKAAQAANNLERQK